MLNSKWTIRGDRVFDLAPFTIAGIVNVTPDSFSDGGLYFDHEKALARALELLAEGAAILDIGGESTRPDSLPVNEGEEERRVVPVVRELTALRAHLAATGNAPESVAGGNPVSFDPYAAYDPALRAVEPAGAVISVDTWRAGTAVASLEAGADVINDIAGAVFDPAMAEVLAAFKPGYILGHCPEKPATMQRAPHYDNVVEEVYAFFAARVELLVKKGLPRERIVLDPGLGFGKNLRHNLELLRNLERLQSLGLPLCIGLSRKTLIGNLLGLPGGDCRDAATQTLSALLLERGALLHRVHDASGTWNSLRLAAALV